MRLARIIACAILVSGIGISQCGAKDGTAESNEWRLGVQAWSFNRFTFVEAIEKSKALGLKCIEGYPGQRIGGGVDGKTHHSMNAATRKRVKKMLAEAGIKWVNYGVVGAGNEAQWRELFEFCKDMGIETIVSEPSQDQLDMIEKLCDEFGINLAIHNHPKSSKYWNPDTVLQAVKGRSKRLGACADTGHWARSGLDPIECLRKLEGRIISLHFKDLNVKERKAHDVPWGTGACNVYGMLAELKRQGFEGVFSVEYEYNWANSVPEIRKCAEYFRLLRAAFDDRGYKPLFKDDLSNATLRAGGWELKDGVLTRKGGRDIWTKGRYGDFILDLDFKCAEKTNSGIFIRCDDIKQWLHTSIEVQVLQGTGSGKHDCGSIYDCLAPAKQMIKKAGEWNHYTIITKGSRIYVVLNGEQVIDMDLDQWTEAHKNPDGSRNKFNIAYKDMARDGFIGFQDHGNPVWYKNIRIKKIEE
jgi:sugar phosphate isomerase/epimerase